MERRVWMEHLLGICCALKLGIMRNEDGNNNKRRACNRKPYGTWWLIAHYSDAFVTINASRCRRQVRCRKGKKKFMMMILYLFCIKFHFAVFDDVESRCMLLSSRLFYFFLCRWEHLKSEAFPLLMWQMKNASAAQRELWLKHEAKVIRKVECWVASLPALSFNLIASTRDMKTNILPDRKTWCHNLMINQIA